MTLGAFPRHCFAQRICGCALQKNGGVHVRSSSGAGDRGARKGRRKNEFFTSAPLYRMLISPGVSSCCATRLATFPITGVVMAVWETQMVK